MVGLLWGGYDKRATEQPNGDALRDWSGMHKLLSEYDTLKYFPVTLPLGMVFRHKLEY